MGSGERVRGERRAEVRGERVRGERRPHFRRRRRGVAREDGQRFRSVDGA